MTAQLDVPAKGSETVRICLLIAWAYASATLLVACVDTLIIGIGWKANHGLTALEVLTLPLFGTALCFPLHAGLLLMAAAYFVVGKNVPLHPRVRAAAMWLPLAVLLAATAHFAIALPFFQRLSWRHALSNTLTILAPIATVTGGVLLENTGRGASSPKRALLLLPGIALLAIFLSVFTMTESVTARTPAAVTALVALVHCIAYVMAPTFRPRLAIRAGLVCVIILASLLAVLPHRVRARAEATVAHKTLITQSLLFVQLAVRRLMAPPPTCLGNFAHAPPSTAPARFQRNVLVLSLDALRADHLAMYGYDRATMPHVETLMRDGLVFDVAYSAAPATAASMAAQWTGVGVPTMRTAGHWPQTLQERLRDEGYAVIGTDASGIVRDVAPGFPDAKLWNESLPLETSSTWLVDRLIESIERQQGPFIAFTHFMETHDSQRYQDLPVVFSKRPQSKYDDALHHIDDEIGRLLKALARHPRAADTIIVLTADHGEFFGEHGRLYHGSLVYEPVMRVPFAIRAPGLAAGRSRTPASGFDFAPTVYALATGSSWPGVGIGIDLVAAPREGSERRVVFMENVPGELGVRRLAAIRRGRYKYTTLMPTSIEELFDLEKDPGELDNLAGDEAAHATLREMRVEMARMLDQRACVAAALTASNAN